MLLPVLDNLDTYEQLAVRYLILDIGLKRIEEINQKRRPAIEKKQPTISTSITTAKTAKASTSLSTSRASSTLELYVYRSIFTEATVTYFNYYKTEYYVSSYSKSKRIDLKAIEEELSNDK